MSAIKVIICGIGGRMGQRIASLIQEDKELKIIEGIEKYDNEYRGARIEGIRLKTDLSESSDFDIVIDFSEPQATLKNLSFLVQHQKPIVIGTTGFSDPQKKEIKNAAKRIPICFSSNMSVGVNVLFKLISEAVHLLGDDYDVEVIEAHHNKKRDAPSGTAKSIGEVLLQAFSNIKLKRHLRYERNSPDCLRSHEEIGMQSIRGGDIVGDHAVIFSGLGERIEIKHQATNRDLFAKGAIRAAKWLMEKPAGLYDMQDVLGLK